MKKKSSENNSGDVAVKSEPRSRQPKKSSSSKGNGFLGLRFLFIWLSVFSAYLILLSARLANSPSIPWVQLVPFGAFSVFVLVSWLLVRNSAADAVILQIVAFLTGIGTAVQFRMGTFSESGGLGFTVALPLGFVAMLTFFKSLSGGRWKNLVSAGTVCYVIAVLFLAAMLIFGKRYRGGIYLPGNFNPTEIVKPLLVVFLASFLSGRKNDFSETQIGIPIPPVHTLWVFALLWLIPVALVVLLHDLGLLLLLNATMVVMLYAIGRKVGYLIIGGLGVVASGALVWAISAHAKTRFDVWLNPFSDPTGSGWQILQGLSALNAGGIWGAGFGAGTPQSVPIVTSDFVYAAIAEEFGIILCGLILLLYGVLFIRGWRAASENSTPFGSLLAVGITASLCFQTLLNVGGVTKAIPLTGIVLPFISQGGSSLVTMLVMAGILLAVSAGKKE